MARACFVKPTLRVQILVAVALWRLAENLPACFVSSSVTPQRALTRSSSSQVGDRIPTHVDSHSTNGVSYSTVALLATGIAAVHLYKGSRGTCGTQRSRKIVQLRASEGSPASDVLSGKWDCFKTEGDIDAYWKACGLPWLARKGFQLMDWGAGKNTNVREFTISGDDVKMEYSFVGAGLGGLGFTETYTIGKGVQEVKRMGGAKLLVDPAWDSQNGALTITNMNPAEQTAGWTKSVLGGKQDADDSVEEGKAGSEQMAAGKIVDVHKFYLEGDALVLEADSTPSGGPVVKWFLRKEG